MHCLHFGTWCKKLVLFRVLCYANGANSWHVTTFKEDGVLKVVQLVQNNSKTNLLYSLWLNSCLFATSQYSEHGKWTATTNANVATNQYAWHIHRRQLHCIYVQTAVDTWKNSCTVWLNVALKLYDKINSDLQTKIRLQNVVWWFVK